jgi:hypothetical protein
MLYTGKLPTVLFAFGLLNGLAGCGGAPEDRPNQRTGTMGPSTVHSAGPSAGDNTSAPLGTAGSSAPPNNVSDTPPTHSSTCAADPQDEGCPCQTGATAACWTGPLADRNVGACHDGLQICNATDDGEFAAWGPCMGEQLSCGTDDAGVPPPPPEEEDCSCIPGAVIQCSEDCSVGIICSLTATKTCLPDRTWSVCREEAGVQVDAPGVQCRNMLHGCLDVLNPDMAGQNELYVGDCSTQFECHHAPPPPETPPPPPDDVPID